MSNSGKQSPLGVNVLSSVLQNKGLTINTIAATLMGASTGVSDYTSGTLVSQTCLNKLTSAIRLAYTSGMYASNPSTYENLISIGNSTVPALGNSLSSNYTYTASTVGPFGDQPAWGGANYTGQNASFGYIRLFAWQAYDEFNINQSLPQYKDFLSSIMSVQSYIDMTNSALYAMSNGMDFLDGTYSNMNDLITADISGINLATLDFGADLVNLGKAINLAKISTFGLPSNLLFILNKYKALTSSVSLALISSGLDVSEVEEILKGVTTPSQQQELKIYQAFSIILGQDLLDVLIPLNCKTKGLESLADLLNPIKIFPISYASLTVPVYNTTQVPTNSKTYYLIYINGALNSQLTSANITSQIGTITPTGTPPIDNKSSSNVAIDAFLRLSESERNEVMSMYATYVDDPSNSYSFVKINITKTSVTGGQERFPLDEYIKTIWYPIWGNSAAAKTVDTELSSTLNVQPPPMGFGSYLYGILPDDIAVAAGAFGVTMQQVKNISLTSIENFAQVVSNLETTKGLAVNGTSVPTNQAEIIAAYQLLALGSGPRGTYTYSDFFGCMSSLPYDWVKIKTLISNTETQTLYTIYQNLYDAVVAYDPGIPATITAIQDYIDQANAEISSIQQNNIDTTELNTLWDITGKHLTIEQRARAAALFPLPNPRDGNINRYPITQVSFVDSIPSMALQTEPHGIAQTLEAISDLSLIGGESLVGMMRESRNQDRLNLVGIPLDNDISDSLSSTENKELVGNGVLPEYKLTSFTDPATSLTYPATDPAVLNQSIDGQLVQPVALGFYDPDTDTYDSGYRKDEPLVPGTLAGPSLDQILPQLDPIYFSDNMLPSTLSTMEAIDDVIRCNCDCWDNL